MPQTPQSLHQTLTRSVDCDYLLFLPSDYATTDAKYPLLLFLHGSGESGHDLERVKIHGVPKIVETQPDFPFIALSPQNPGPLCWWSTSTLIALLDEIERTYRVDTSRVYVTGLSMGGYGTWQLAIEHPERFAAIAPVCGGAPPWLASRLKDVPVWAFHGAKDEVVPPSCSQDIVTQLQKLGADVQLTIYPEAGHDAWTETYNNPALYAWFLRHRRG